MTEALPPVPELVWLEREQNPFNVRCLDVRSFTTTMISTAADQRQAIQFRELRNSKGEEYIGKTPENSSHIECQLRYPHQGATRDGPLYMAKEMEDKWDVFCMRGTYILPAAGQVCWFTGLKSALWIRMQLFRVSILYRWEPREEYGWRFAQLITW